MDASLLRLVVILLSAICCLCIVGIAVCAATGHEVPPSLNAVASMASGSLVGILVVPRGGQQNTYQAPVNNPLGDKK
jgi:hypothetical protein